MALTDEEEKKIAAKAVRSTRRDDLRMNRDWVVRDRRAVEGIEIKPGQIFVESPIFGRVDIYDFIVELQLNCDEWKRRALAQGCVEVELS